MAQADYSGGKSTHLKDIEAEVNAAFDGTVKKTKQELVNQSFAPVSVETAYHSTASGNVSQPTKDVTKPLLPKTVTDSTRERSLKSLNNRGITQTTMDFGQQNLAPALRDHLLNIPARQDIEPMAQTFADVHKLASNNGNGGDRGVRTEQSNASSYEAEKERLKKEAEQEFVHNNTDWSQTMIRNFVVNPDLPQTAGLINYLQLLLQSPKGIEYERYTAAEQEAEKAQRIEEIKEWANEKGHSLLLSALYGEDTNGILNLPSGISLVIAPFQGADYLLDALETAYVGAPLPSSTPDVTETTQALREGVSQNMTETGQFFYNIAMSTADSLIAGLMGGSSTGGGIILGMGAASNTAHDIMNRGGTEEDALIGGAVSGILEGVFEKVSLGQLESMKMLPVDTVKDFLGNISKSVLTNAGEEFATELANTIFDTIFMGELSTYELTVQGYLSQGKSEADARRLANMDLLKRLGESAASGALTGVLFGAGASAESYYRSRLAAQGEARLRAMEMPTPKQLEAMNASEAEARGAMVLLNLEQFDDGKNSSKTNVGLVQQEKNTGQTLDNGISGLQYKEEKNSTAEESNQWFVDNVKDDYKPPYKPGTIVKELELTQTTTFVRVYDKSPTGSGMYGSWMMRAEDIQGLTPMEIQDKFALPNIPKYICDVELSAGTRIRAGEVNPIDEWGSGGGIQYDLIGQRIGEFKNERLLEEK